MNTSSEHYQVEETGGALQFRMPFKTQWFTVVFMILGCFISLIIFAPIFASAFLHIVEGTPQNFPPIFLLLIAFPVFFLALMGVEAAWQIIGKEIVEVEDDGITFRHLILGVGISKKFHSEKVNGVFVSHQNENIFSMYSRNRNYRFLDFKRGRIALNYGKSIFGTVITYRCGSILHPDEANEIITAILRRFPKYKYDPNRSE